MPAFTSVLNGAVDFSIRSSIIRESSLWVKELDQISSNRIRNSCRYSMSVGLCEIQVVLIFVSHIKKFSPKTDIQSG